MDRGNSDNDAIIVGGGLAGLTAAVYLAGARRRVTLFEKAPDLGGRAATQQHAGSRSAANRKRWWLCRSTRPRVPGIKNLYLAGDWVGGRGFLSDASFASARQAAQLVLSQGDTMHVEESPVFAGVPHCVHTERSSYQPCKLQ